MFEHAVMKKVSGRISNSQLFPFAGEDPVVVQNLKIVAEAFVQLQIQNENIAQDYLVSLLIRPRD